MLVLILIALLTALLYFWNNKQFKYWKNLGVPQFDPSPLFGDVKDLILQKKQASIFFEGIYQATKSKPVVGLYLSYKPTIMINNFELAKDILSKDFNCFHDRGFFIDTNIDPLTANLFCMEGARWRNLRQKITPLFTGTKLKMMLPLIQENFKCFEDAIDSQLMDNQECIVDIRDYIAKLALTLISSTAFGIQNDCFKDPNNLFRIKTLLVLEPSFTANARFMTALFMSNISKCFKIGFFSPEVNEFFIEITKQIIDYREKNKVERSDFLHLLAQLRQSKASGTFDLDDFTLNDVAANAFIFVLAGYETTAATIAYCLFELVRHPDMLNEVLDEIEDVKDVEFSYEKLNRLKYLESCINETLRKYPILPFLNRKCLHDYHVPGTSYVIPKGTQVILPIYAMQRDPDFYPNPTEFLPDRGNEFPLLTFGYGNRTCIGKKMALVVTKCYIYDILSKYSLELKSSSDEVEFAPNIPSLTPKENILIQFRKQAVHTDGNSG